MIYKDAIFGVAESDDEEVSGQLMSEETEEKEVEVSVFNGAGTYDFSGIFPSSHGSGTQIKARCSPGLRHQKTRRMPLHLE